jgi:signal transduction histidine kinase
MEVAYLGVAFKRIEMLLRWPSPTRYAATWAFAWCVLTACLALDVYSNWTLANLPAIGAEIRSDGSTVVISNLEANSALGQACSQAGVRVGDRVLAIAGRPVDAAAFLPDPDNSASWSDRDRLWEWQRFLESASSHGSIAITILNRYGTRTITCPVQPLGWEKAVRRSWALRLVGWSFLLLALLIWIRKQNETSIVNLTLNSSVFVVLSTMSTYINRDYCISASALTRLTLLNFLATEMTILTPLLGLVFPSPVSWLKRLPWVRYIPWCAYLLGITLHFRRTFPNPTPTVYLASSLSLLIFFLIFAMRLLRATNPLVRAQLQWVTLGSLLGFLPWVLLSALPEAMHMAVVPERFSLLSAIAVPLSVYFAIRRYRLIDVDQILDWVVIHAVAIGAFALFELLLWNWLSRHYTPQSTQAPLLLALSLSLAIFIYAPLRSLSMHWLRKLTGRIRPSLDESLQKLLARAQATGNPTQALEQTLRCTLQPRNISWVIAGRKHDALLNRLKPALNRLKPASDGMLGYELGEACPRMMESAAWIPIRIDDAQAALVLFPQGARGWSRHDLRIARALARSCEPLFEMQRIQLAHTKAQTAMREQRDELMSEMHDGLGSQLFGASLLSNVSENMPEPELRARFRQVSTALSDAMDSLRTGLTVLSAPPYAFGPAVMALLLRAEHVLESTGIELRSQIDDETISLQLNSRHVFSILRAMQEALTNIARHSRASHAQVSITLQGDFLAMRIDDDGVGFVPEQARCGHGLTNMNRRLQIVNGTANITSAPHKGCVIELRLPLPKGAA